MKVFKQKQKFWPRFPSLAAHMPRFLMALVIITLFRNIDWIEQSTILIEQSATLMVFYGLKILILYHLLSFIKLSLHSFETFIVAIVLFKTS